MRRFIAILLPVLILAVMGFGTQAFLASLAPKPEKTEEPPKALPVFVKDVERVDYAQNVVAQGEVRPRREIVIAPAVAGRISWISDDFVDGGFVRQGQVLARIDPADFELAVIRARAAVATAQQAIAREEAEAAIALRDIDELGLQDAGPLARREPQLAEARAALQSAEAQLREAELALERTALRVPFDGRINEKMVDIGQFMNVGTTAGRMFGTERVEVSLPISDEALGRIGLPLAFNESARAPGPQVVFTATVGGKPREWTGRVTRSAASINAQTRLINIVGEVVDPYGTGADDGAPMAPGLFVEATIAGAPLKDVLWVPREALRGLDRIYVGNPETDTLAIRTVEVAHSDPSGAYLYSGVEPGEAVIVSPVQAPFDGMRVQILRQLEDGTVESDELSAMDKEDADGSAQVADANFVSGADTENN